MGLSKSLGEDSLLDAMPPTTMTVADWTVGLDSVQDGGGRTT